MLSSSSYLDKLVRNFIVCVYDSHCRPPYLSWAQLPECSKTLLPIDPAAPASTLSSQNMGVTQRTLAARPGHWVSSSMQRLASQLSTYLSMCARVSSSIPRPAPQRCPLLPCPRPSARAQGSQRLHLLRGTSAVRGYNSHTSPVLAADTMSALTLASLASATADMAECIGDGASDRAADAGSPGLTCRSITPGSLSP